MAERSGTDAAGERDSKPTERQIELPAAGMRPSADVASLRLASLEGLPMAVLVEQDGVILGASEAAARLLGAEAAGRLRGQPLARFLGDDSRARIRDIVEGRLQVSDPPTVFLRRTTGERIELEALPVPLRLGGRPAMELLLRAVTEARRAEPAEHAPTDDQLRQAQKMDAVGRLASGIAHDFNNILTAIRGHAAILLEDLPAEAPCREDALDIQRAADRASDLTRQLLHFARGRPGHAVPVDLNCVVVDVGKLLRRLIRADVELRTELAPALPMLMADPGQLQQVVLNLVVNASEAIVRKGVIQVTTRTLSVADSFAPDIDLPTGEYVQLSVSDNGPGISEDVRLQLFEPFFTTKPQGTGLGLSTVYGIVRKSGGTVRVRSEPGTGTTFEVILPASYV